MTARWERSESLEGALEGPLFMDAVLTPNRSLSRRAFALVIGLFALANGVLAIMFLMQGAYPVSGFLGLDVLALAWAFHLNYRAGRARELVRVGPDCLSFTREAKGRADHWRVSPLWARVETRADAVRISAGGRAVAAGGFLSPEERAEFANALSAALAKARTYRPSTSAME